MDTTRFGAGSNGLDEVQAWTQKWFLTRFHNQLNKVQAFLHLLCWRRAKVSVRSLEVTQRSLWQETTGTVGLSQLWFTDPDNCVIPLNKFIFALIKNREIRKHKWPNWNKHCQTVNKNTLKNVYISVNKTKQWNPWAAHQRELKCRENLEMQ